MTDSNRTQSDARSQTGIRGLDTLLAGGFPANRLHLVEGSPGTGKTTLALQFLLEGRRLGERCLYVTMSETTRELRGVAESHGWTLDGIEIFELARPDGLAAEQYTLYHPSEIELGELAKAVLETIDRVKPTRIVLDSLSEMRLLARDPLRYRRQILAFKEFLAQEDRTVLMLDDLTSGDNELQLQSIAHGVVRLEQAPYEYGRSRRRLRIIKVRGVAVTEGYHDFKIQRGGLVVYPQLTAGSNDSPRTGMIHSGVEEIDRLLGGGINWGTCTLLLGPAGVGKSSLAAQYVTATALDSPAAVFLFDERRATFIDRCENLGMDMRSRLRSRQLTIEQVEPGDLSPGEFAHRVCMRVDEGGCRVVMIDSVNGYLHAIPSAHAPLVRMHELLAYLNERAVATLLIAAQHGLMGAQMMAPIDVSYLADCVVLLRYFEAQGAVRKAISVVKKRTGMHESTIREFAVGPDRLRVGEPLVGFQGVMTGVPQYVGSAAPLLNQDDEPGR
ncbi:MAG TPA: ATPase domain-containing protein [Verrucomicrobiae bacterium]|nr:ATPase domain-containing protein [Verrucomicrobiae bacterium]